MWIGGKSSIRFYDLIYTWKWSHFFKYSIILTTLLFVNDVLHKWFFSADTHTHTHTHKLSFYKHGIHKKEKWVYKYLIYLAPNICQNYVICYNWSELYFFDLILWEEILLKYIA